MVAGTTWFASQGRVDEDDTDYHSDSGNRYVQGQARYRDPRPFRALAGRKHVARLAASGLPISPRPSVIRVGIEASGGYERGVVGHLREKGFTVSASCSRSRFKPTRECIYGGPRTTRSMRLSSPPSRPRSNCRAGEPDERLAELAQHLTFVEQIEEDIARFKVRLEHIDDPRLRRMAMADIARLKARRSAELLRIVEALRAHVDLARRLDLVLSVPGIGERTALALIIRMPELGKSAARRPPRWPVWLRSTTIAENIKVNVTSPAVVGACAARSTPLRCPQHSAGTRPLSRSTPASPRAESPQRSLIACARKLLIFANTVVQRGTPWTDRPLVSLMVATGSTGT